LRRTSLMIFLGLCILCIVHALYYYFLIPEVVASHFGSSGKPDAWSSRNFFITVYLVSVGMTAVIFLGIVFGMPRLPNSMINLPNKDFWLSKERRDETFHFFFHYFLWFGSATFLLLLDTFHQSFMVHLGRAVSLNHTWLSIILYLGFSIVWSIGLFVRFMGKKEG